MKTVELKIQKPAYGGYGLGFHEGKACFVDYAVPGDFASVEIYKEKKDYSFARIVKLIEEASTRAKPVCPNFGMCGGCSYLNISYEEELLLKKEILEESLIRITKLEKNAFPDINTISDRRLNYRSHASIKAGKNCDLGFYLKDSNELVKFPETGCCLLTDTLAKGLSKLRINHPDEIKIASSHDGGFFTSVDRQKIVCEVEQGIRYERDIKLFFQANRYLRSKMLQIVKEYAGLSEDKTFIDIGCGIGFFSIYLAEIAKYGYGIDINKESIRWAKHNAALNKYDNIEFETRSASEANPANKKFDTVIADPPRAGLSEKARTSITAISPERIVYVSCNPATFARDARNIINEGYALNKLTMIDMFPATHHIETIALFIR